MFPPHFPWFLDSGVLGCFHLAAETEADGTRYADQAAVDAHKASPKMAWLMEVEKEEGNMAAPLKIMPLEAFAGWASR